MISIDDQYDPPSNTRSHLFAKVAAIVLVILTFIFIFFLLYTSSRADNNEEKCVQKCKLESYFTPPLVILSLDGFSKEYLDRGIFKSLEQIKECGATAEFVFPSFPSKTFPNHFTIASGVYPESHGIVDNEFYNEDISPIIWKWNQKTFKDPRFFTADPIWNQYQREGGISACYHWFGCSHNISGMMPKLGGFEFDPKTTLEDKFEQAIAWLNMPSDTRPGLIMLYHNEPDETGHYHAGDDVIVNAMLKKLEEQLQTFINQLRKNELLNCINVVIVSDHGMQQISKNLYLNEMLNIDGMKIISGPAAKIYKGASNLTNNEIINSLVKKADGDFRIYTRNELPTRMHHVSSYAVGNFNIIGKPGVSIVENNKSWTSVGGHGYDYLDDSMHTVFFARGPSIKQGTILQPFQNIEYLNLFRDLLGLPHYPNNGTLGVMDEILANPPVREKSHKEVIRECQSSINSTIRFCGDCDVNKQIRLTQQLRSCSKNSLKPLMSSDTTLCYKKYCNRSVIHSQDNNLPILWEFLTMESVNKIKSSCYFTKENLNASTDCKKQRIAQKVSLSAQPNADLAGIQESFVNLSPGFVETVLDPLNRYALKILEEYGDLVVVSGLSRDISRNGNQLNSSDLPSHFFRILLRCDSSWTTQGSCEKDETLHVFAFIFPINSRNSNQLNNHELLLEYSARLKDVELMAGFDLVIPNISMKTRNLLKTKIHLKLWETKIYIMLNIYCSNVYINFHMYAKRQLS